MSFKKTMSRIQNSLFQFPCIRLDDMEFYLDAHLSKHHMSGQRELSVRMSLYVQKLRTALSCIRPNVSATRPDAFSVRKVKGFLSKTQIWEDSCNRPDDVAIPPDAILDKASRVEDVQPSRR
jgi:hypothetical protein